MQEQNERNRLPSTGLSVATLRRSSPSPHMTVTRTLRLTEAEHSSRESTPLRISLEELSMRPRSNPRSRTPMRFESPLNHSEFRRESLASESEPRLLAPQRVTIRPLAGSSMGTAMDTRIREDRPVTPKSRKQGPSHRKVRRWNNDHFGSLAHELAASSRKVAHVLAKAQGDAHLYKPILDPSNSQPNIFDKLVNDKRFESLREKFMAGELPESPEVHRHEGKPVQITPTVMLQRIDPRLRRVVHKAALNSQPACFVMDRFEDFVARTFAFVPSAAGVDEAADVLEDLLLERPTATKAEDSSLPVKCHFFFHHEAPSAGFHRLLLHAICQFHGLQVVSKMMSVQIGNETRARSLIVTGKLAMDDSFRLTSSLPDAEV